MKVVSVASIDVLANDWDPNNDPIALIAVGTPLRGTAANDGSRSVYTRTLDFGGYDTFTYTISDERFTAPGMVTVSVPQILRRLYLPLIFDD